MRSTLVWALATLGAHAINLQHPRDPSAPRVVQHNVYRNPIDNPVLRDRARMRKRQSGTVNIALDNEVALYYMNVSIGTPVSRLCRHPSPDSQGPPC